MQSRFKFGFLFLIALSFLRADTVELRTGEKIECLFKRATDAGVVVEVAGQPMTIATDKVRAIYFGATIGPSTALSGFGEALDALKAVRSVTTSGVSYRDYAPRVLEAKIKIDKYLQSTKEPDQRSGLQLRSAMRYYVYLAGDERTVGRRGSGA
jgi:hypothetical protein